MATPASTSHAPEAPRASDAISLLLRRWRDDPGSTYNTWFLWPERLKNFRSIRRGLAQVVAEIEADAFGSAYKGSSLETVVGCDSVTAAQLTARRRAARTAGCGPR